MLNLSRQVFPFVHVSVAIIFICITIFSESYYLLSTRTWTMNISLRMLGEQQLPGEEQQLHL